MPNETLKSLNDTNINVLFGFLNYMGRDKSEDVPEWFKPYMEEYKRKGEQRKNG